MLFQTNEIEHQSSRKPTAIGKQRGVTVVFKGIATEDVQNAAEKLKQELDQLLAVERWTESPFKSQIKHLCFKQVSSSTGVDLLPMYVLCDY